MKTLIIILLFAISSTYGQSKTYILVHGAWHGAWCWKKVVPLLEAKGNNVVAIDLPGHGKDTTSSAHVALSDYVNKVVATANAQKGQVILVGHSMAGVVISQAAEMLGKQKVSKLIYLDAFMPQNGESVFIMVEKAGKANAIAGKVSGPSLLESLISSDDHKTTKIKPEMVKPLFYHDCSAQDITFAQKNLGWQSMACLATPVQVSGPIYGAIPKFYILCTDAKDLDKSSLVNNMPCEKVYTLKSSHSPFFSMPEKLVEILNGI